MVVALIEAAVASVSLVDDICIYALQTTGVLAHPIRRRIVAILVDRNTVHRKELAQLLASDEMIAQDDSERIEIALHHNRLPKLNDELVVEYDRRNGDVVLWVDSDTATKMLESTS